MGIQGRPKRGGVGGCHTPPIIANNNFQVNPKFIMQKNQVKSLVG